MNSSPPPTDENAGKQPLHTGQVTCNGLPDFPKSGLGSASTRDVKIAYTKPSPPASEAGAQTPDPWWYFEGKIGAGGSDIAKMLRGNLSLQEMELNAKIMVDALNGHNRMEEQLATATRELEEARKRLFESNAEIESLKYAVKEKDKHGVYWHDLAQTRIADNAQLRSDLAETRRQGEEMQKLADTWLNRHATSTESTDNLLYCRSELLRILATHSPQGNNGEQKT